MSTIKSCKEQIRDFESIDFKKAQELYKNSLATTDSELKKMYLDKIILGSLHVVYDFIDRNNLKILGGSRYDIDDIESAFVEAWIRRIQQGDLLVYNQYLSIINNVFLNDVCTRLDINSISIHNYFGVSAILFADMFYTFLMLKNTGREFDYDELLKNLDTKEDISRLYSCPTYRDLMLIFEKIYDNLQFDKTVDLKISKNRVHQFINLFIDTGLYSELGSTITISDNTEDIINEIANEKCIREMDNILTSRRREVMHKRYGLDGDKPKTLMELAEEMHVTWKRVQQIEHAAIRKLQHPITGIRNYYE